MESSKQIIKTLKKRRFEKMLLKIQCVPKCLLVFLILQLWNDQEIKQSLTPHKTKTPAKSSWWPTIINTATHDIDLCEVRRVTATLTEQLDLYFEDAHSSVRLKQSALRRNHKRRCFRLFLRPRCLASGAKVLQRTQLIPNLS